MPNHIKNKLELIGQIQDIDSMIKKFGTYHKASLKFTHNNEALICENTEGEFCWFSLTTGRSTNRSGLNHLGLPVGFLPEIHDSFFAFPDFAKVVPPPDDPAYKDLPSQDAAKHSPNWWYTWNCKHWGSKWGGYEYERDAINIFTFETAWSAAPEIIEALSLAFPSVTIKYTWADEDTGHNCGRSVYHNGLIESFLPDGGSIDAYNIAFELRPDRATDYELVDGKYRYIDQD